MLFQTHNLSGEYSFSAVFSLQCMSLLCWWARFTWGQRALLEEAWAVPAVTDVPVRAAEEHSPLFIPVVSNCWSKQEETRSLVFCSCQCHCCVVSKWFLLSSTNVAKEGSKCSICVAEDAVPARSCSDAHIFCLLASTFRNNHAKISQSTFTQHELYLGLLLVVFNLGKHFAFFLVPCQGVQSESLYALCRRGFVAERCSLLLREYHCEFRRNDFSPKY